ncbi:SMI1/KNR4 family protein [Hahella sp. HN01]|uniref:SMI1/KNR4 family protein n=1 Tax=Hahella sp. HN01 TaxID=2847262 RepID=UPI001C1EEC44|nr:SMI1/KNR4 family protein [Hahella sp. HN01]MBU6955948.1 SMI1/KNR4 family protein [Hahella sp. HN01]
MITDWLTYITRFDSAFREHIKGVSSSRILHLERLLGCELPGEYKDFLNLLGDDSYNLDLIYNGTTNLEDIIDFYEQPIEPGDEDLFSDYFVIGLGPPPTEMLLIDRNKSPGSIILGEPPGIIPHACSLGNFLYHKVFARFEVGSKKFRSALISQMAIKQEMLISWANSENLYVEIFSDKKNVCVTKRNTAVLLGTPPSQSTHKTWVLIGSDDRNHIKYLEESLAQSFELRMDQSG